MVDKAILKSLSEKGVLYYVVGVLIPISQFFVNPDKSKQFCPFHDNKRSEAGKLFRDAGMDRLYCFSEKRQFNGYDYVKKVLDESPIDYLLSKCSEEEVKRAIKTYYEQEVYTYDFDFIDRCALIFIENNDMLNYIKVIYDKD